MLKHCLRGNNKLQKDITFYNIAVEFENRFESEFMHYREGRPPPLEAKECSVSRSMSKSVHATPSRSMPRDQSAHATPSRSMPRDQSAYPTPSRSVSKSPPRSQSSPPKSVPPQQNMVKEFHKDYLESLGYPPHFMIADISDKDRINVPGAFRS
jgi:hypothetical protein